GHHHHLDPIIEGASAEEVGQLTIAFKRQRIFSLRAIEGHRRNTIHDGQQKVLRRIIGQGNGNWIGGSAHGISPRTFVFQISPPATAIACPVIALAPSPHSHSTVSATSAGVTSFPCGLCFASSATACSRVRPVLLMILSMLAATRSVSVNPGHTAFT